MKRLFLSLTLALLAVVQAWAHDFEVDGIYYKITSSTDMKVSVSYRGSSSSSYPNEYSGSVVIPESVTYNGNSYSVTEIGSEAFYGCSGLTSVVISSSVTSISDGAFIVCEALTSVVIPSSVTSIGERAFYGCSGLTSVVIPSSVTSIGGYAFSGCGLTSVVIPSSMTSIGGAAFLGCALTSVVIHSSVTSIGEMAFWGCRMLTSVEIPSSVTSIGERAFEDCAFAKDKFVNNSMCVSNNYWGASIYEHETADGLLIDKNEVKYCRLNATSVVIPSSVTSIGERAFQDCSMLTSVEIPSSVTSIGEMAFYGCSMLTSVEIPSSVTSISVQAFWGCSELTSVEIPSSVTSIGSFAFSGCSGLTSVVIPSSVTSIGDYAFRGCSGLTSVNFNAEKCSSMGSSSSPVFSGCSSLTEINIGDNVTTIPSYAFYGCSGLTSVVIPSSVTSIGQQAFYNVTKAFFLTNTKPSIGRDAFYNCKVYYTANDDNYNLNGENRNHSGTHKVYSLLSSMFEVDGVKYIPTSMSQRTCDMVDVDYSAVKVNSAIGPTVKYTNSTGRQYDFKVNNINCYAGYECNALSDLYLNITEAIEDFAFYYKNGNEKITKIKLGDKITSIGSSCFSGCSSLLNITIPKLITTINTSTFEGCSSMTSVTFNNAVTSIGSDAFKNCSKLASLTIPANVASIASGAFDGCTSIDDLTFEDCETAISIACKFVGGKNLYLGRNVTYSMSNASPFSGNNVLETVMTNMNITSVPNYEFYNCKSLKDVYLSDAVTTIGRYAFSGDVALANFEVGMSVESIGAEAFSDCTALLDFKSHSILPAAVGTEALDDIDKLECTLHVPEGTKDAYMAADQWKEFWIEGDLLPRYKVIATVDPECAGMGTVKGSNGYDKNTMATLEAVPDEWHRFVEWSDGNKQNPRTMTVTEAVNLTAKFAYRYYIKTQPAANNISVALSEMVSGVEYKWYVSETEGGAKDITNDLQSTGSYAWRKSGGVWTSGNKGVHGSSSTLSMDIAAKAGDKLTFDYSVSSEASWDKLTIYLGNNQIGSSYSGSASGKFEYTFESDMNTTLKFVYSKDGSGDNGSDQATISNVIIENAATLLDGEVYRSVSASTLEIGNYYYCEVVMPDGTVLTSDQVQYEGGQPTAIEQIGVDDKRVREGIYDIMGRKLPIPQRGINIINGKKVIVR